MSLQLPFGVDVLDQLPIDAKYLNGDAPYSDVAEANSLIASGVRHIGLKVNINYVDYWYKDGIADIDLVEFSAGGGSGTNGGGLPYTAEDVANKSTDVALGTSDVLYPSQNAVKAYVDAAIVAVGGGGFDGTASFALEAYRAYYIDDGDSSGGGIGGGGGTTYAFENGLTELSGTVALGGDLLQDTSISGGYNFLIDANSQLALNNGWRIGANYMDIVGDGDTNVLTINGTRSGLVINGSSQFDMNSSSEINIVSSGGDGIFLDASNIVSLISGGSDGIQLQSANQINIQANVGNSPGEFYMNFNNGQSFDLVSQEGEFHINNGGQIQLFTKSGDVKKYGVTIDYFGAMVYDDDYSSDFGDRSLVDKAYVDSIAGSGSGDYASTSGYSINAGYASSSAYATNAGYASTSGWANNYDKTGLELTSNKSTTTALGTSNTLYPSQNAVKSYVDARVSGTTNTIPKIASSNTLGDSHITDNGTTVAVTGAFSVSTTTTLTGDVTCVGNLIVQGQAYAEQGTLTFGTPISWNLNTDPNAVVTLTGNTTLNVPTNMKAGGSYTLIIKQDGTGSRTLAYNSTGSVWYWSGGVTPILTTTANAIDIITFISDGTKMYGTIVKDFHA